MRRWVLLLLGLAVLTWIAVHLAQDEGHELFSDEHLPAEKGAEVERPVLHGLQYRDAPRRGHGGRVIGVVRRAGFGIRARVEVAPLGRVEAPTRWSFVSRGRETMADLGEVVASTAAAEDGAYAIAGLGPGRYEVRATAADGARGLARFRIGTNDGLAVADVEIAGGTLDLEVVARQHDDAPFSGTISVDRERAPHPVPGLEAVLARAETDERGRVRFQGLPRGRLRLTALAGRRVLASTTCVLPREGPFRWTIDRGTKWLAGRVTSRVDGTPFDGASVVAWSAARASGVAFHAETRTSTNGRFELRVKEKGGWLLVQAAGYAPVTIQLHGQEEDLEIPLSRGGGVQGRVLRVSDGTPVSGARVVAVPVSTSGGYRYDLTSAFSDRTGRFELRGLPVARIAVFACGGGWVSPELVSWKQGCAPNALVPASDAPSTLDLDVVPTVILHGRVVDSAGSPVPRAEVALRPDVFAATLYERSPLGRGARGFSDEDGTFTLSDLLPGVGHTWTLRAPDGRWATGELPVAEPGSVLERTLTLPPVRLVEVRVVTADGGAAIAGAEVVAVSPRRPGFGIPSAAWSVTDEAGVVRLGPLGAGAFDVIVRAREFACARERDAFSLDEQAQQMPRLTVELDPGLTISGVARLPDGEPAGGGEVHIRGDGLDMSDLPETTAPIAEDGSFTVTTLGPGTYRVTAHRLADGRRYAASRRVVAPSTDLQLQLELPSAERQRFRIRFLGPTGSLVPYGKAIVYQEVPDQAAPWAWESPISAGVLSSRRHEEGTAVWVEAFDFRDAGQEGLPYAPVLVGPVSEGALPTEIRLEAAATLAGRVVGANGDGVANARIVAFPHRERPRAPAFERTRSPYDSATTDASGRFQLRRLAHAAYRLRVEAPPGWSSLDDVHTSAPKTDLVIRLPTSLSPLLTVQDADGIPVPFATIRVRSADGADRGSFRTDDTGSAALPDLDPGGAYRLEIRPPSRRQDLFQRTIEGWRPVDGAIRLERAYHVSGRVIDEDGRPVPGIRVACRSDGASGSSILSTTDASGAFTFSGLRTGFVLLRVWAGRALGSPEEPPGLRVEAGTTDAVLELAVGSRLQVRIDDWQTRWRFADAVLTAEAAEGPVREAEIDRAGHACFYRLDPDLTYVLWVRNLSGGHFVHATGLTPEASEHRVPVRVGGTVQGEVILPDGVVGTSVRAQLLGEGVRMQARLDDDGAFVFTGVPPGSWLVEAATPRRSQPTYAGTARASAGDRIRIRLTRR